MRERTRLTHCPETGCPLESIDIRAHAAKLWPALDPNDPRFVEARRRRDLLIAEADARDAETERRR